MEQVAHRLAPEQREPAAAAVLRPVVEHVPALTERGEVAVRVVGGVVVPVCRRQHHAGRTDLTEQVDAAGPPTETTARAIAPSARLRIPPAAIAQADDTLEVRLATALTAPARAAEADHGRELGPVDRVEALNPRAPALAWRPHRSSASASRSRCSASSRRCSRASLKDSHPICSHAYRACLHYAADLLIDEVRMLVTAR